MQITDWMREASVPGVGICIIEDAKLAWKGVYGVRDRASGTPVDTDTMFEAASMSKPVFAYVVMKLCEAGVMNLDAPLTRYTADRFLDGDDRLASITARHVLAHTSGFQNWRSDEAPLKIHFPPGERFLYSGEGYNYLQTVVTQLLGRPFESYMKERLFEPLGMASSGYVWNDTFAEQMARPHDPQGKPIDNKRSTPDAVARYGAAGALLTTPSDFARFVIAVIDPPPRDEFRLDRKSIAEMLRPHVRLEGGLYPGSWALGWHIVHNSERDLIYHGGDNEGFHSLAVASVAGKSGIVVMTNGENGTAVLQKLIQDEVTQSFLVAQGDMRRALANVTLALRPRG
jgi:CubicO group peptidase (beta-lactamase class C family)